MINKIKLKSGRSPTVDSEPIEITPITIFVGPNNSGKSRVLSEINRFCVTGEKHAQDLLLDTIEFAPLTEEHALESISRLTLEPESGDVAEPNHIFIGKRDRKARVKQEPLIS